MPKKKIKRKASQCKKLSNGERCGGRYILEYEGNIPIFKCDLCADLELTWKKFYEDYLHLYSKKENWEIKKHQISCIIGFFCHCYKEFYGIDYVFVPNNINPYSCKECRDSVTLLKIFNDDAVLVRKYIHWFFKKFVSRSIEISSLGYLNSPGIVRKFNLFRKNSMTLNRSSQLPKSFVKWCFDNIPEVFNMYSLETMNDLGVVANYINNSNNVGAMFLEQTLIDKAKELKLIVDGRLNIGK